MLLPHKYTDTSMAHRHTTYVHTYWVHNLVTSFYQQHIEIQQMPRMASMRPKISFSIFAQSAMCWFRRDVDGFDGEADFVDILQRMQNIILARFSDFSRAEKNWNVKMKCFFKKISFLLFTRFQRNLHFCLFAMNANFYCRRHSSNSSKLSTSFSFISSLSLSRSSLSLLFVLSCWIPSLSPHFNLLNLPFFSRKFTNKAKETPKKKASKSKIRCDVYKLNHENYQHTLGRQKAELYVNVDGIGSVYELLKPRNYTFLSTLTPPVTRAALPTYHLFIHIHLLAAYSQVVVVRKEKQYTWWKLCKEKRCRKS